MDQSHLDNPGDLTERATTGNKEALGELLNAYRPYSSLVGPSRRTCRHLGSRKGTRSRVSPTVWTDGAKHSLSNTMGPMIEFPYHSLSGS